mmetsp:Transcript_97700/g.226573  ORF Transcript_97700/g.226573 Transcript_97700/m.226573 type:complete len:101 (-) Transcript_97700:20-322(-)
MQLSVLAEAKGGLENTQRRTGQDASIGRVCHQPNSDAARCEALTKHRSFKERPETLSRKLFGEECSVGPDNRAQRSCSLSNALPTIAGALVVATGRRIHN